MQELASLNDFSVGQEQSPSNVTHLFWSPTGYTEHGRPILAVLTSNFVLSLWACNTDPFESEHWERVFVVNNVIRASLQQQGLTSDSQSRLRIRNMSWSPPRYVERDTTKPDEQVLSSRGNTNFLPHLYFAVVNDADEALVFKADNPYEDNVSRKDWEKATYAATLMKSETWSQIQGFSQEKEANQPTTQPGIHSGFSLFALSMQRTCVLDNISWGPWNESANEALLTLRRAGRISHCILRLTNDATRAELLPPQQRESLANDEHLQVNPISPVYGPSTWFQKVFLPSMANK